MATNTRVQGMSISNGRGRLVHKRKLKGWVFTIVIGTVGMVVGAYSDLDGLLNISTAVTMLCLFFLLVELR